MPFDYPYPYRPCPYLPYQGHSAHHATGHAHCALEAVYGAHTGAVCLGAHALESTHHTHGGSETAHGELGKEGREAVLRAKLNVGEGTHGGVFVVIGRLFACVGYDILCTMTGSGQNVT